jgi:hypothetical protein
MSVLGTAGTSRNSTSTSLAALIVCSELHISATNYKKATGELG